MLDQINARDLLTALVRILPPVQDQAAGNVLDGYLDAVDGKPHEDENGPVCRWAVDYSAGYYMHDKEPRTLSERQAEVLSVVSLMLDTARKAAQ